MEVVGSIKQFHFKKYKIVSFSFAEISSEHFYHGKFLIDGIVTPCILFYFSDLDIGSFVYQKVGTTEMFQFSLIKITSPQTITLH